MNQLLDYLALIHRPYLHAKGEIATEHLVKWLDCQAGEKILEFGVGTGGTLVKVASRHTKTRFWGVDSSDVMIDKTAKRLKFCRLSDLVVLKKIENGQLGFFSDNYFDKIYVESVLGIQNDETLRKLIATFNRILKSSGKLIFNETIWLENANHETIKQFNQFVKENFGIIQANSGYPYLENWKLLLKLNQFEVVKIEDIDRLNTISKKENINENLSKLFTLFGNIYGKIFLKQKFEKFDKISQMNQPNQRLMAGYLVVALNTKPLT